MSKRQTSSFFAHGVAKSVFSEAEERNLQYIDATCPLVTKVHIEAKRYHKLGYQIIMIGIKTIPKQLAPWATPQWGGITSGKL